ncbi:ABC transporter ATP-binding protein [Olegusella massiliensis]|uniref:ABC transporter ATP-binding protein n=1 Tax=Olegusella massiliensis TaxID=1776381 RepID=UPI0023F92C83|nr:ABC transporter ATP-binding protein [Olegusella massiliensis]MBS5864731.1 ABC transporter ATP-binding protein [Coriobacteriaceae bacterium]
MRSDASVILQVNNVGKTYGNKDAVTRALAGVSFAVQKGEFVAIMGPSGSGKSTLLNCIATIDMPDSGTILVGDQDSSRLSQRKLADFRRKHLGFIFQDSNLLDALTAYENIALPLSIDRVPAAEIASRVESVAATLGITEVLDKRPSQMSGGQRQRVAAARAIVTNPDLVLADEPTGALDSKNSRILLERLENLNRVHNATVLMVTHDAFAASYCRRVIFIRDGRLFTEQRRGEISRRDFYERIVEVVATIGGGADAR